MIELETVDRLRQWLSDTVKRLQEDRAAVWKGTRDERHSGGRDAIALQDYLAKRHQAIAWYLERINDDAYLAEWCDNINRARSVLLRARRLDAEERQRKLDAMTPEQRAQHQRDLEDEQRMVATMISGLVARDVQ